MSTGVLQSGASHAWWYRQLPLRYTRRLNMQGSPCSRAPAWKPSPGCSPWILIFLLPPRVRLLSLRSHVCQCVRTILHAHPWVQNRQNCMETVFVVPFRCAQIFFCQTNDKILTPLSHVWYYWHGSLRRKPDPLRAVFRADILRHVLWQDLLTACGKSHHTAAL